MFHRLFRMLVSGLVIFYAVVHGGRTVSVCSRFVEFRGSWLRVIWHSCSRPCLPLDLSSTRSFKLSNYGHSRGSWLIGKSGSVRGVTGMGRPVERFRDRQLQERFQQRQATLAGLTTIGPAGKWVSVAQAPWSGNFASLRYSVFSLASRIPIILVVASAYFLHSESTSAGSSSSPSCCSAWSLFLDGIPGATRGRGDSEEDCHNRSPDAGSMRTGTTNGRSGPRMAMRQRKTLRGIYPMVSLSRQDHLCERTPVCWT